MHTYIHTQLLAYGRSMKCPSIMQLVQLEYNIIVPALAFKWTSALNDTHKYPCIHHTADDIAASQTYSPNQVCSNAVCT